MEAAANRKWALSAAAILFALALCEGLARLLSPGGFYHPLLPLRPHLRLELETNLPGVAARGTFSKNRWGLRGDEPPQYWVEYETIVAVGGSTTECFFLDDRKTWPYLLQERLKAGLPKVWVGNAGLEGHSTRGHILMLRDVIPRIHPKAVLFLVGINDLIYSFSRSPRAWETPEDQSGWRSRLLGRSRLVQLVYEESLRRRGAPLVRQDRPEGFKPLRESGYAPPDLDRSLPSLAAFRENLRTIVRLGRERRLRMFFLTQPLLYGPGPRWEKIDSGLRWPENDRPVSGAGLWKSLERFNRELLKACREEGVECLDLASAVPHDARYFYDAMHFSEAGAALAAERAAKFLAPRLVRRGAN